MSYINCILYGACLPSFDSGKKKNKEKEQKEVIKADDPKNRKKVSQLIASFD